MAMCPNYEGKQMVYDGMLSLRVFFVFFNIHTNYYLSGFTALINITMV